MQNGNAEKRRGRWAKRAIYLTACLGLLGGGLYVYKEYVEDNIFPKRWGVVEEGKIYRSGQLSARLVRSMLETHGIRVIVDLTRGAELREDQVAESKAIEELNIDRLHLQLGGDGTGDLKNYVDAIVKIHGAVQEGKPVLVHCAAGAQRTGGTVAFYRLLIQNKSPDFVLDEMEAYDWRPKKDAVLVEYVNKNMEEMARKLVESKVLDRVPEKLPVLARQASS